MDFRSLIPKWTILCFIDFLLLTMTIAYPGQSDYENTAYELYAKICNTTLKEQSDDDGNGYPSGPSYGGIGKGYPSGGSYGDDGNDYPSGGNYGDDGNDYPSGGSYGDDGNSYKSGSGYSDDGKGYPYPPGPTYGNDGNDYSGDSSYPSGSRYSGGSSDPDYTSLYNQSPPALEYVTTNCTDLFPTSGQCVSFHGLETFNFLYWAHPTGACYVYEGEDCKGNGDGGANDFTFSTGQAPSASSNPQQKYLSFKCFAKYVSNPDSIYAS